MDFNNPERCQQQRTGPEGPPLKVLRDLGQPPARSAEAFYSPSRTGPQNPREWEKWLAIRTAVITTAARPGRTEEAAPRLMHAECRRGLGPGLRTAYEPSGRA